MTSKSYFKIDELEVRHEVVDAGQLIVDFSGRHLQGAMIPGSEVYQRYDETFDDFLSHIDLIVQQCESEKYSVVEVHIEGLDQVMSRTRQTIYRLIQRVQSYTSEVRIYGSDKTPPQREHWNMTRIFVRKVAEISKEGDAALVMVEI